jgi:hypothetical protein
VKLVSGPGISNSQIITERITSMNKYRIDIHAKNPNGSPGEKIDEKQALDDAEKEQLVTDAMRGGRYPKVFVWDEVKNEYRETDK